MSDWTAERQAEIQARCDAATEGPWEHTVHKVPRSDATYSRIHSRVVHILGGFGRLIAYGPRVGTRTSAKQEHQNFCDGEFQAHARTDLPDALARIAELEEELTKLRAKDEQVCGLIAESRGIEGLHLNGDIATWEELMYSFDFHTWLDTYAEDFPVEPHDD